VWEARAHYRVLPLAVWHVVRPGDGTNRPAVESNPGMPGLNPLRYALRGLVRSPLFTVTVVASLAIGIAASSTIFSLADALFLRPRAGVVDEARVVDVGRATDGQGFDNFGYQVLLALQQGTQTFEGIAGFRFGPNPVSLDDGHGGSERAHAALVSANYFKVLGTRAAAGRLFAGDEDRVPDQALLAVLNYDFWTRRFNRSPDAIGQTLRINRRPYTVIGVAEPGFHGTAVTGADLWVPFAMAGHITGREGNELLTAHGPVWHMGVGRLKPGVSLPQARDELNALLAPFKDAHPEAYGRWSMTLLPSARVPGKFRKAAFTFVGLLFLLTVMVLAIACSNVAGMLLARALGRRREMATRLAVGASRAQIAGHLMVETALLFLGAAIVSLMLSWWMIGAVMSFMPALPLPVHVDLRLDWRVSGFALLAALVTAGAFGLAPALGATRLSLAEALHGQHSTADHRRLRLRHVLLGGQVALSLALLVTTGLFVRAIQHAANTDTGYSGANVGVFSLDLSLAGYRDQQAGALADLLLERMSAIGGVERAAASFTIPLQGSSYSRGGLRVPGYTSPRNTDVMTADWDVVSPTYFETLGVPIVRGRGFDAGDREGQGFVAIVNETFAARVWPRRGAVGQVIYQETKRDVFDRPLTVVGVARDADYRTVGEDPRAFIYVPMAQQPITELNVWVRHGPGQPLAAETMRRLVAELDPGLPLLDATSFEDATGIGLVPQRLAAAVAGGVGMVGLLLTALGLYGLVAFQTAQRTREIAVRMALGATRGRIVAMMMRHVAGVTGLGAAVGLLLAGGVAVALGSLFAGMQSLDGLSFLMGFTLLGIVLILAALMPARRAASTDPAVALRSE